MTHPERRPWYTQPGFLAAAVVVLIAILGLVLVGVHVIWGGDRDPKPEPTAIASTPSSPVPVGTAGCGTDTGQTVPPVPPVVRWETVGQVKVPVGTPYGPCRTTATTASGYAHTPGGALVAAVQIRFRSGITDPINIAADTITGQFTPGKDRDTLLSTTKSAAGQNLEPGQIPTIAAYSITTYTPDTAVISLAMQVNQLPGQYVSTSLVLRWIDGDWRLVPPIGGSWDGTARTMVQLTGFTSWGP